MAEEPQQKIVLQRWQPESLETLTLNIIVVLLWRLNDSKIDSQFPWLSKDHNPFIGIPHKLIESMMQTLASDLYILNCNVQKDLLKILMCKPLQSIELSHFIIQENDMLDVLRMIETTRSKLRFLEVSSCDLENEHNPWIKVPEALSFFKECVKNMPSLTSLNVSGICDDELLEAVALGCPNLLELVAESNNITSEGLKKLCTITGNADDGLKGCHKLMKIKLIAFKDDYLLDGIESLLINLPNLRVLECSPVTLGKVIEKLHNEKPEIKQFQLRELMYDGSFQYTHLPSILATRCPFLIKLRICNVSHGELMRFECIKDLREIWISSKDSLLSFGDDIAPFLQKMGKRLECLFFNDVEDIDFNIIDTYCPNLVNLQCFSNGALTGKISTNPDFKNLRVLALISLVNMGLQPVDCICLLSKCYCLRRLSFDCCEDLCKDNLREILLSNALEKLKKVFISSNTLAISGILSDLQSICN